MRFYTILLLICIGITPALCQKIVRKAMLLPHVTTVQIDAERFSSVNLETAPGVELRVEATLEGEYQRDIGIEITETGNTVGIAGAFQPFFEAPNDKLSAHKVVAVTLLVQVPEDKSVLLYGTGSQVVSRGAYRELEIVLNDGHCSLENPEGNIRVITQSGNISLAAESGKLEARSKYGKVHKEQIPNGSSQYTLESVRGNINIKKKR